MNGTGRWSLTGLFGGTPPDPTLVDQPPVDTAPPPAAEVPEVRPSPTPRTEPPSGPVPAVVATAVDQVAALPAVTPTPPTPPAVVANLQAQVATWRRRAQEQAARADRVHADAHAGLTEWRDLANRLQAELDQANADLREMRRQQTAAAAAKPDEPPVVHRPWPHCGGEGDPLCQCAPGARLRIGVRDWAAEALADQGWQVLRDLHDTLLLQVEDWGVSSAALRAANPDVAGVWADCAERLRGIVGNIPGVEAFARRPGEALALTAGTNGEATS